MFMILLALSGCCSAFAQYAGREYVTYAGLDFGRTFMDGSLGIRLGHGFAGHWSVGGEFVFPLVSDGQNEDEKVHGEGIDVIPADIGGISFEARADYWFSAPYDGLHLGTCLSGGLPEEAPVLRVDIGYMVVFMKAIRAGASVSWNVGAVDIPLQARMTIGCVF